jgi:hypothetical protein
MYTKLPYIVPNGYNILQMIIKYNNIFHSKAIQNLPKLGFLVWKQTIWQPRQNHFFLSPEEKCSICFNLIPDLNLCGPPHLFISCQQEQIMTRVRRKKPFKQASRSTRVTRLGKVCFLVWSFFGKLLKEPIFLGSFFDVKSYVLSFTKRGWAMRWAIFSRTNLVTLHSILQKIDESFRLVTTKFTLTELLREECLFCFFIFA